LSDGLQGILTSDVVQMFHAMLSTHCHAEQVLHVMLLIRNMMAMSLLLCCSSMPAMQLRLLGLPFSMSIMSIISGCWLSNSKFPCLRLLATVSNFLTLKLLTTYPKFFHLRLLVTYQNCLISGCWLCLMPQGAGLPFSSSMTAT
jgi:hypothetical protein